ncbi:MAG: hypothetical protein CMP48_24000 [Rickettsiales bacterium]|nr:hypothetical protein [Rickettsiales bacterium]
MKSHVTISRVTLLFLLVNLILGSCETAELDSIEFKEMPTTISYSGTAYYVQSGAASGGDGSYSSPFNSIQDGVDAAGPGDAVFLRGGTYHETVWAGYDGTSSNHIVIASQPGETAIIDGQNSIPSGLSSPLFRVVGDYVEVHDIKIKNSLGRGMQVNNASNVYLYNIETSYNLGSGIHILTSNNVLVEGCTVFQNCRTNVNHDISGWPAAFVNVESTNTIIRGNTSRNNHGEGIDDLRSENTIIENNVAYDNWAINYYLDNSQNSTLQNNIAYATGNTTFWRFNDETPPRPSPGIIVNDESYSNNHDGSDQTIINNLIFNTSEAIGVWGVDDNDNLLIANNTIINTKTGSTGNACLGIQIKDAAVITNSVVTNNIVYHTNSGDLITGDDTGVTFSYNSWSSSVDSEFQGTGDVVGNPMLSLSGNTGAGQLTSGYFELTEESPVIDAAQELTEVPEDYYENDRSSTPDMGAHEIGDFTEAVAFMDSYTVEAQASSNKGTETTVNSNSSTSYRKYPFLKFWTGSVSGTVLSATLKLYVDSGTGTSGTSTVYSTSNSWTETDITWSNMPSTTGSVGSFDHEDTGSTVEVPISTSFVTGNGTYSFVVIGNSTNGRIDYASREYATGASKPRLKILYDPNN